MTVPAGSSAKAPRAECRRRLEYSRCWEKLGAKIKAVVLKDEVTFADGDGGCGLLCLCWKTVTSIDGI